MWKSCWKLHNSLTPEETGHYLVKSVNAHVCVCVCAFMLFCQTVWAHTHLYTHTHLWQVEKQNIFQWRQQSALFFSGVLLQKFNNQNTFSTNFCLSVMFALSFKKAKKQAWFSTRPCIYASFGLRVLCLTPRLKGIQKCLHGVKCRWPKGLRLGFSK